MEYEEDYLLNDEPEEETEEERAERERLEREREAEREQAKRDAEALSALAEQANAEMRALEDATAAQSQPPPVPPIVEPTPQMPVQQPYSAPISNPMGRMYMGPNISDAELEQLVPRGTAYSAFAPDVRPINEPLPGSLEEALAAARERDVPGRSRTLAIQQPIQEPPQITVEPMKSDAVRQSLIDEVVMGVAADRNKLTPQQLSDKWLASAVAATAHLPAATRANVLREMFPREQPQKTAAEKPPALNNYETALLRSYLAEQKELNDRLASPFLREPQKAEIRKQLEDIQRRIDALNPAQRQVSTNALPSRVINVTSGTPASATNRFKIRMVR